MPHDTARYERKIVTFGQRYGKTGAMIEGVQRAVSEGQDVKVATSGGVMDGKEWLTDMQDGKSALVRTHMQLASFYAKRALAQKHSV